MKKLTIISLLFLIYFFIDYTPVYSQTSDPNVTTSTTDLGFTTDLSVNINTGGSTGSTGGSSSNDATTNPSNTTYTGGCTCHHSYGAIMGVGHYEHGVGYGYGHYICSCQQCHQ